MNWCTSFTKFDTVQLLMWCFVDILTISVHYLLMTSLVVHVYVSACVCTVTFKINDFLPF